MPAVCLWRSWGLLVPCRALAGSSSANHALVPCSGRGSCGGCCVELFIETSLGAPGTAQVLHVLGDVQLGCAAHVPGKQKYFLFF